MFFSRATPILICALANGILGCDERHKDAPSTGSTTPPAKQLVEPSTLSLQEIVTRTKPSVVSITLQTVEGDEVGYGSGYLIDGGLLVTNRHVAALGEGGVAVLADGAKLKLLNVIAEDEPSDLVLLTVEAAGHELPALSTRQALPLEGEKVVVIGNPHGLGHSVSDGIISAVRKMPDGTVVLQTTAPVSPGSSGSALLNMSGEVIGIISAQFAEGQNLNFAIPASQVAALRRTVPKPIAPWARQTVTKMERDAAVEIAGELRTRLMSVWRTHVAKTDTEPQPAADKVQDLQDLLDGTVNRLQFVGYRWERTHPSIFFLWPDFSSVDGWQREAGAISKRLNVGMVASPEAVALHRIQLVTRFSEYCEKGSSVPKEEWGQLRLKAKVEILELIRKIVALDPENDGYRYMLAKFCADSEVGRASEAAEQFEILRAKGNWRKCDELLDDLSKHYEKVGDAGKQLSVARDQFACREEQYRVLKLAMDTSRKLGKDADTMVSILRMNTEEGGESKAHGDFVNGERWLVGELCLDTGRLEEAKSLAQDCIRDEPEDDAAHALLGQTYVKLGDRVAALDEYKILQRLGSKFGASPSKDWERHDKERIEANAQTLYKAIYP